MNIPDLPYFDPVVDSEGKLTSKWLNALQQLLTELQTNASNEGIQMPPQPTTNIVKLNTQSAVGRIIYDSTQNLLFGNINGTFKQITTS